MKIKETNTVSRTIELSGKSIDVSRRMASISIFDDFDLQLDELYIYRAPRESLPEEKRRQYASAQDVKDVCDLIIRRATDLKDSLK